MMACMNILLNNFCNEYTFCCIFYYQVTQTFPLVFSSLSSTNLHHLYHQNQTVFYILNQSINHPPKNSNIYLKLIETKKNNNRCRSFEI